jgi:hypothetical protein
MLVYMSKQRRLRPERAAKQAADPRDHIARVVSDEVWAAFRAGLGTTPVNVALGELVRREVGRQARRSANDAGGIRLALADAREVADELASLIARFERDGSANDLAAQPKGRLSAHARLWRYGAVAPHGRSIRGATSLATNSICRRSSPNGQR